MLLILVHRILRKKILVINVVRTIGIRFTLVRKCSLTNMNYDQFFFLFYHKSDTYHMFPIKNVLLGCQQNTEILFSQTTKVSFNIIDSL